MAHHLNYLELASYVSLGLGAFRMLSQFAIKMIAIFARDKFSARAFAVLRIGRRERPADAFGGRTDHKAPAQRGELEVMGTSERQPPARRDMPVVAGGQRRTRHRGRHYF
jgi:hypothetical protein